MLLRSYQPSEDSTRSCAATSSERYVSGLDVFVHGARIVEGGGVVPVGHVPRRLGQEHATHVAAPHCVAVPIESVDGVLGGEILSRLGLITCYLVLSAG